jgi:hypothetical protein
MPERPVFNGLVKPITVQSLLLDPPEKAAALERQGVTYTAWVDFEQRPIAIETSSFGGAADIIEVIARKYGEPDEIDARQLIYRREQQVLHIYQHGKDQAFLRYEDISVLESYMEKRNLSLKRKFRNNDTDFLVPGNWRSLIWRSSSKPFAVIMAKRSVYLLARESGFVPPQTSSSLSSLQCPCPLLARASIGSWSVRT